MIADTFKRMRAALPEMQRGRTKWETTAMNRTILLAVAALNLVAPSVLLASDAAQITTLEGSDRSLAKADNDAQEDNPEILELRGHIHGVGHRFVRRSSVHAMLHRQRFNQMVNHNRNFASRMNAFHERNSFTATSANAPLIIPNQGPLNQQQRTRLKALIEQSNAARDFLKSSGAQMSPKERQHLESEVKEGQGAQARLAADNALKRGSTPPSPTPGSNGNRLPMFGERGNGGGRFGDGGQVARGGDQIAPAAPGSTGVPGSPITSSPRLVAQPPAADKPICLSGSWAEQDQQRQYVCLSWFYRGRIYTPEQLEQALAQ
jgi:hypothetical protein